MTVFERHAQCRPYLSCLVRHHDVAGFSSLHNGLQINVLAPSLFLEAAWAVENPHLLSHSLVWGSLLAVPVYDRHWHCGLSAEFMIEMSTTKSDLKSRVMADQCSG